MKKFIALASAVAVTATAALAIDWGSVENLAQGATVTVSSNPDAAATITDGNDGSSWQATGGAQKLGANDWALIDLGEEKTFTDIEIKWEASHPSKYSVYTSTEAIPYAVQNFGTEEDPKNYNVINAEWLCGHEAVAERTIEGEAAADDNIVVNQTARYILIYSNEPNNFASYYGSRIFEVRVANMEGRDVINALVVNVDNKSIDENGTAVVNVVAKTYGGETVDLTGVSELTLTADPAEGLEITAGDVAGTYTVKGVKYGEYKLTATGKVGDNEVSGTAELSVKYHFTGDNIAEGKTVTGRTNADAELTNPAANAVDGDSETFYAYNGNWSEGWVIVDLGKDYVISEVAAEFADKSGGDFFLSFASEGATMPGADDNWKNNLPDETGWTKTGYLKRKSFQTISYKPETPVRARYVAYRDNDCPNGNAQLAELYIAGVEYAAPVATTVVLETGDATVVDNNEKVNFTAKVFDQYGAEVAVDAADVKIYEGETELENGVFTATAKGNFNIVAKYNEIESEPIVVNVVADVMDFFAPTEYHLTFDGTDHDKNLFIEEGICQEWQGDDHGKSLVFELIDDAGNKWECDLDMIKLYWEAACPEDYTVKIEDINGASSTVNFTGRTFEMGTNPVDRIADYSSDVANGPARVSQADKLDLGHVHKITITPTKAASQYGSKLFRIGFYGKADAGMPTSVKNVTDGKADAPVDVYTVYGIRVRRNVKVADALNDLPKGIYIVNGKKIMK